jgi:hypothetical protein
VAAPSKVGAKFVGILFKRDELPPRDLLF